MMTAKSPTSVPERRDKTKPKTTTNNKRNNKSITNIGQIPGRDSGMEICLSALLQEGTEEAGLSRGRSCTETSYGRSLGQSCLML